MSDVESGLVLRKLFGSSTRQRMFLLSDELLQDIIAGLSWILSSLGEVIRFARLHVEIIYESHCVMFPKRKRANNITLSADNRQDRCLSSLPPLSFSRGNESSWTSRPCRSRLILELLRFLLHSASRLGRDGVTDFRVATPLVLSLTQRF